MHDLDQRNATMSTDAEIQPHNRTTMETDLNVLEYGVLALYLIISISGTVTNASAIGIMVYHRRLRQVPFNLLVIYLAIVDLISCCLSAPTSFSFMFVLSVYRFRFVALCQANILLHNFSKLSSLTVMSEMAIMRVLILSRNGDYNRRVFKLIILATAVVLFAISVLRSFPGETNICNNTSSPDLFLWINITILLSLALILCLTYGWIGWYTSKKARELEPVRQARLGPGPGPRHAHGVQRFDVATIRACTSIVACYVLCHLPYFVYGIVTTLKSLHVDTKEYAFYYLFILFSNVGNPIILYFTSKDFKKYVLRSLYLVRRRRRRRLRRRIVPVVD